MNTLFLGGYIDNKQIEETATLISEQEIIIDLYNSQRFLIEQDTEIFSYLNYNFINEGLLEKAGTAIVNIIKEIGKLMTKFISFITSKRKENNKSNQSEQNEEKIVENIKQETNDIKEEISKLIKSINDLSNSKSIQDKENELQKLEELINTLEEVEEYIPIYISESILKTSNISDKWDDIEKYIDIAYEMLSLAKERKSLNDKMSELKGFSPSDGDITKLDNKSIYSDNNNLCNRETYYNNYYRNAKAFFRNYTDESSKNIKYLENLNNNRIKPLQKEVEQMIKNMKKQDGYKKTINNLQVVVQSLSYACTSRIKSLVNVEKVYSDYKRNIVTTNEHYEKINRINLQIQKIKQDIKKLS